MGIERKNPWMGLASYQDPETSGSSYLFCGRSNESYDVSQLIENNIFITLYGKSGTGKTSLLNAGVFPLLRKKRFIPVSIRLGMEAIGISFQQCITDKICQTVEKRGGALKTVEVVPLACSEEKEEFLWSHFARTRYQDNDGNVVFPVVVLDQFEEVFRGRRKDAETLLRQISFLMNETHALSDRIIDGFLYTYDFNFRFVVSIREDDLFRLEDSIDNNYLPEMKGCRYRLRNLTEEGAREVILSPAGDLFKAEDRKTIADIIISIAQDADGSTVSSNILSLVCSRIFAEYQKTDGEHSIDLSLVEKFIGDNLFEKFYKDATKGLSAREKSYLELNLVDSTGRRNSIPDNDFRLHVRKGDILFEGNCRILQRVSTSSEENGARVELIHDSFCAPLAVLKEKREKRKIANWITLAMMVALVGVSIGIYTSRLNRQLEQQIGLSQAAQKKAEEYAEGERIAKERAVAAQIETDEKRALAESAQKDAEASREIAVAARKDAFRLQKLAEDNAMAYRNLLDSLNEASRKVTTRNKFEGDIIQLDVNSAQQNEGASQLDDGVQFEYESPTQQQIVEWKNKYYDICVQKVESLNEGNTYVFPPQMMKEEPCLVFLILNSKSIDGKNEKQSWFDLYPQMNEEQINKLYDILLREGYRLTEIERRYQEKQREITLKYAETYNTEAYRYAQQGDFVKAHEMIDIAIQHDPEGPNWYDSKGEFYLMQGKTKEALQMWNKVIELDPSFFSKHNNSTKLYEGLLERGLINE